MSNFYGDSAYPKIEKVKRLKNKNTNRINRIINIVFTIIVILIMLIVVDIIAVSNNRGPYFAINTKTYNDGGTKEYTGLFYKVIKYNQEIGRKDMEIGTWNLKYYVEPIDYSTLDLALDLNNYPDATYKKIAKKFMRVSGKVFSANKINNEIILQYLDEDNDYTLNIVCKMYNSEVIDNYKEKMDVIVLGSVVEFKMKSKSSPNTLTMNNCFIN